MEETIHIIHAMDKHNFLYIDATPWNVMTRERKNGGFSQPAFIDFALSRAREPEKSDAKWYEAKCMEDKEGALVVRMKSTLKDEFKW